MKFLSNLTRDSEHTPELYRLLKTAKTAWFFVAYLRVTGLNSIETALRRAARRHVSLEFFCDTGQCISEPEALDRLRGLLQKCQGKLYLVEPASASFHPKLYCFFAPKLVHVVVGSANLSGGGLEKNTEASICFTVPSGHRLQRDIEAYRDAILKGGAAEEADTWNLKHYAKRFGIIDSKRRKAQKEAHKEISQIDFLDRAHIKSFLGEYNDAENGAASFDSRTARYATARQVIQMLCDKPVKSRVEFLELYGRLVGNRGEGRLWYSSGLQRSKNRVASAYRHVTRLMREIRANRTKKPDELFALALDLKEPIKGLGVNVITEIMNTLAPRRFSVLNGNPLITLEYFGHPDFRPQDEFSPADYAAFTEVEQFIRGLCGFTVGQVDHFLDFVYWRKARAWKKGI